jgi:hypothetical protein
VPTDSDNVLGFARPQTVEYFTGVGRRTVEMFGKDFRVFADRCLQRPRTFRCPRLNDGPMKHPLKESIFQNIYSNTFQNYFNYYYDYLWNREITHDSQHLHRRHSRQIV